MTLATGRVLLSGRVLLTGLVQRSAPNPLTAPVISGITVAEVGAGTLRVSWDVDQPAQGWVSYGTTNGGPYPSDTTHETSFDYTHHSQDITGIGPGVTVYLVIVATNAAGQSATSPQQSATTASSGISYTDYTVPTGAGWTDGTDCIAALQSWFNAVPNGTSATSRSRVIFTAGYTWTCSKGLSYYGRSYITFYGQGTPLYATDGNGVITACGNSGGGKVKRTAVSPSGDSTQWAAFTCGQGGTAARATDIRWEALQIEGGLTAALDLSTTMASGGNEYAAGIWMGGQNGGEVSYCNFYRTTGDGIVLYGSAGAVTGGTGTTGDPYVDPGDFRTTNVSIHHNWIRSTGRVGIFPGKWSNLTIANNLFQDSAYAFIDFEPDYWHMTGGGASGVSITGNSFTGGCNWALAYYMPAIQIGRVTGRAAGPSGWHIDGPISITGNRFTSAHKRNTNGTQPAGTSGQPDFQGTFGPIYKDGTVTFSDNRRIGNTYSGNAFVIANATAGGAITGNTGFGSSTFAGITSSGTFTQSGNS